MKFQDQNLIMVDEDYYSRMIRGKRSKRPRPASPLGLTMATALSGGVGVDLSRSSDHGTNLTSGEFTDHPYLRSTHIDDDHDEDMANCLILLAGGGSQISPPPSRPAVTVAAAGVEIYRCKTCNRSFSSFQALGGHTASHKKPDKPPTNMIISAAEERIPSTERTEESVDGTFLSLKIGSRGLNPCSQEYKSRVHECSICGAEFGSGQALGGHMRRHRPLPPPEVRRIGRCEDGEKSKNLLSLDLNLPAAEEQALVVFSASSMVNCHY